MSARFSRDHDALAIHPAAAVCIDLHVVVDTDRSDVDPRVVVAEERAARGDHFPSREVPRADIEALSVRAASSAARARAFVSELDAGGDEPPSPYAVAALVGDLVAVLTTAINAVVRLHSERIAAGVGSDDATGVAEKGAGGGAGRAS